MGNWLCKGRGDGGNSVLGGGNPVGIGNPTGLWVYPVLNGGNPTDLTVPYNYLEVALRKNCRNGGRKSPEFEVILLVFLLRNIKYIF